MMWFSLQVRLEAIDSLGVWNVANALSRTGAKIEHRHIVTTLERISTWIWQALLKLVAIVFRVDLQNPSSVFVLARSFSNLWSCRSRSSR